MRVLNRPANPSAHPSAQKDVLVQGRGIQRGSRGEGVCTSSIVHDVHAVVEEGKAGQLRFGLEHLCTGRRRNQHLVSSTFIHHR